MSGSAYRYTCDRLGTCQDCSQPCAGCPTRPRIRAGRPVSEGTTSAQHILRSVPLQEEIDEAAEAESGMQMLAYALIAAGITVLAIALSFYIASLG